MRARVNAVIGVVAAQVLIAWALAAAPPPAESTTAVTSDQSPASEAGTKAADAAAEKETKNAASSTSEAPGEIQNDEASRLVYSVNRTPERTFDTGRAVQVITAEDIWRKNARNLPELLMDEAGIFVQQTNYGGGSPIVRGLMGKQIVILLDGVRVNNATFRFGPLQYLNTVDLNAIERIEVVRGVESVLGSDSLGGLINIISKKGPAPGESKPVGGTVSTRFSSADTGVTTHADLFGKLSRFRYSLGGTFRRAGDVTAGGTDGLQREQGYDELARALSAEYQVSPTRTVSMRYHTLKQNEVQGASRGQTTTFLITDPQKFELLTVDYQDLTKHRFFDQLQITGFKNRQEEGQLEVRSTAPNVERRNLDTNRVAGASVQMASYGFRSHRLLYGFDYTSERIGSTRKDVNVATGKVASGRGKFTDNSSYETAAVYLQDRVDLGKWITTTMGARFGRTSAGGTEDSSVAKLDLASTQQGLTGSVGVVGHLSSAVNLAANVTRGFRPPNIDDLSRYDSIKEGVEIPNPSLQPEQSLTYELGVKYSAGRLDGAAFYYNSRLTDLHDRRAGLSNGLNYFDLNANGSRDAGEPNVLQRVNIGRATIRGVEVDGRYRLTSALSLAGNYTTTRGDNEVANEPLSRIPPAYGKAAVRWTPTRRTRRIWSEFAYTFAAAQRRISARDKGDARIGPTGTDGFNVISLRGGFDVSRQVRISLGVENILNEKYKYHASGIFRPGRQIVLGTQFSF